jgi:F-type H+-transporting ATPase subunit gamma
MASQRDVKNRIDSVKNIRKITRAMEMVAAARLRRAEQRIQALRPYAGAIRRMTRQAAEAAGTEVGNLPILKQHESEDTVAILLVTGDRGLAGAFNSQILRAGMRSAGEHEGDGRSVTFYASGRRGVSSLAFRGRDVAGSYVGFTDRPGYADAREIAQDLIAAYVDGDVDRVEIIYNGYVSPLVQEVRKEVLLPLQEATVLESDSDSDGDDDDGDRDRRDGDGEDRGDGDGAKHALVEYEPDPEEILKRLVPDYVEISVYRALLESSASELGARMTAMRSASDNAADVIEDLTLEMNRVRQADITQEIMEVVAGAEALT